MENSENNQADNADPEEAAEFRRAVERVALPQGVRIQNVLGVSERSFSRWRTGINPVNPTAFRAVEWMADGYVPKSARVRDGDEFLQALDALGLTQSAFEELIDVEDGLSELWLDDRGPPLLVWSVIDWFLDGFRPPEWPEGGK